MSLTASLYSSWRSLLLPVITASLSRDPRALYSELACLLPGSSHLSLPILLWISLPPVSWIFTVSS